MIRANQLVIKPQEFPYRRQSWIDLVLRADSLDDDPDVQEDRWIPDSCLHLKNALGVFGNANIAGWDGKERDAKSYRSPPDPPWKWNKREQRKFEYFTISNENELIHATEDVALSWWNEIEPTLAQDWEQDIAARKRWGDCLDKLRSELATKGIIACVITYEGGLIPVPSELWRRNCAEEMLDTGFADFIIPDSPDGSQVSVIR